MNKKLITLPLLLSAILITSCNNKKNANNEEMPEWLNHPHEVLRYIQDAFPKVKMSNHKLTCFDDDLKIRDSIMNIPYADFQVKDNTIEKSKNYVKYIACYGDKINHVMAEMTFYDNGSLFLDDCNNHHYYFNIAEANVKVVFDTTEAEFKKLEDNKPNDKKDAEEACKLENFVAHYKDENAKRPDDRHVYYGYSAAGQEDRFMTLSYVMYDDNNQVLNLLEKLKIKKDKTTHSKNPEGIRSIFEYANYSNYVFEMKNYLTARIVKLYKDHSKGDYVYCVTTYTLDATEGSNFHGKVANIVQNALKKMEAAA